MPLNCQVYVYQSATSGEKPVIAAVIVTNPSATTAIAITGGALSVSQLRDGTAVPCALPMLPIGPGMPVVVPAGGTIIVGPMPLVVHSNGASNSYQSVASPGAPVAPQPSDSRGEATGMHYPQFTALIGATLYGSDGSVNVAGTAPLLVDVVVPPPPGYQGGYLHLGTPPNLVTLLAGVI